MKRVIVTLSVGVLLAGTLSAAAQYRERPGLDFYRVPGGAAPAPWQRPGQGFSYRIRVQRQFTPQAYFVRIDSGNGGVDAVQIRVQGSDLLIGSNRSLQNEQRSAGGGYRFSRFSNAFSQRIRLPRDADMANLRRSEEGGVITLAIPRVRFNYRGGGGYGGWR